MNEFLPYVYIGVAVLQLGALGLIWKAVQTPKRIESGARPFIRPPMESTAELCRSVNVKIGGQWRQYHPHPDCPKHNTTLSRERILEQFPDMKYSINNHRID